jgi:hypothetical protein
MRAPDKPRKRRLADNIERIVTHLRPLKRAERAVEAEVIKVIDRLPAEILASESVPSAAEIKDAADKINRPLAELTQALESMTPGLEKIFADMHGDFNELTSQLQATSVVCQVMKTAVGLSPNLDWSKRLCAAALQNCSKQEITGTDGDCYRELASLLYQALRGRSQKGLRQMS